MIYQYRNPETGQIVEVIQGMNDKHVYKENGIIFDRIWLPAQIAMQGFKVDPFNVKDFVKKTDKPGTVGEVMDRAEEWRDKRIAKEGYDQFAIDDEAKYSKARRGLKIPKKLEDISVEV